MRRTSALVRCFRETISECDSLSIRKPSVAEVQVKSVELDVRELPDVRLDPANREVLAPVVDHQPALRITGPVTRPAGGDRRSLAQQLEHRAGAVEDARRLLAPNPDAAPRYPQPVPLTPQRLVARAKQQADVAATRARTATRDDPDAPPGQPSEVFGEDARGRAQPAPVAARYDDPRRAAQLEPAAAALPVAERRDRRGSGVRHSGRCVIRRKQYRDADDQCRHRAAPNGEHTGAAA